MGLNLLTTQVTDVSLGLPTAYNRLQLCGTSLTRLYSHTYALSAIKLPFLQHAQVQGRDSVSVAIACMSTLTILNFTTAVLV